MKRKFRAPGETRTRLYRSWEAMKRRCLSPAAHSFHRYGGRGITLCKAWHSYDNFAKWARANGFKPSLTLDRIHNDKGYSPKNCRWVTHKRQCRNGSRTIRIAGPNSEALIDIAERNGIRRGTMIQRIRVLGWSKRDAATVPVGSQRP